VTIDLDTRTKAVNMVIKFSLLETSSYLPTGDTRDILAARVEVLS